MIEYETVRVPINSNVKTKGSEKMIYVQFEIYTTTKVALIHLGRQNKYLVKTSDENLPPNETKQTTSRIDYGGNLKTKIYK